MSAAIQQQYTFFERKASKMLEAIKAFECHIYNCWRDGFKTSKIIDTWHHPVTEGDVQLGFEAVLPAHFALLK